MYTPCRPSEIRHLLDRNKEKSTQFLGTFYPIFRHFSEKSAKKSDFGLKKALGRI